MNALLELRKQMEIDFLKTKTYEEINDMFNLLNEKLKIAQDALIIKKHDFSKGYICASAQIVLQHGETTIAQDVLQCNFITIDEMRKIGVEESDIAALTPVINEIIRKNKN